MSPVVVTTQSFPARPSALPEAQDLVRGALAGSSFATEELRAVFEAINTAMLQAAGAPVGTFQVAIRIFPDDVEIEVLAASDGATRGAVPTVNATFADWLAEVLRRQGLSQETAARQLGVSVRTVSRWVRGQTEPRMRQMRRISDVFGPVTPPS
ncbi:MAG: helix-turn-helix domain-containing protein [Mycobacteriales bacterium]